MGWRPVKARIRNEGDQRAALLRQKILGGVCQPFDPADRHIEEIPEDLRGGFRKRAGDADWPGSGAIDDRINSAELFGDFGHQHFSGFILPDVGQEPIDRAEVEKAGNFGIDLVPRTPDQCDFSSLRERMPRDRAADRTGTAGDQQDFLVSYLGPIQSLSKAARMSSGARSENLVIRASNFSRTRPVEP